MPRPRAPWWMYVVAASYLVFLGLGFYSDFLGPEPPGIRAAFSDRGMQVRAVLPGSAAERAGLQPGDLVVAMDGQPVRSQPDWIALAANLEVGRVHQWQVEREDKPLQVALTPARISPRRWGTERQLSAFLRFGCRVVTLILAFVIAFSRPHDSMARLGAWFVAVTAMLSEAPPAGVAVAWRDLPAPVGALVFIPATSLALAGPILLTFFANFPRKLFRARWPWVLVWAPAAFVGPWTAVFFYRMVFQPQLATLNPDLGTALLVGNNVGCAVAGLAVLVLNYRRLEDVNERRRVRLIVAGAVVTWLPAMWLVAAFYFPPSSLIPAGATNLLSLASPLFSLAFPLSLAHAILRHRLFDIRVMIRQGLQYALARRLLLSLVPALAAILLLDLLLHAEQPLASVLRSRGWVYLALGTLAATAHARRQRWMEALDRRFFRERYDAQRLLREVVEEAGRAASFERVAPHVVARIEAALHPGFVALLVREPREAGYRSLAAAPAGQTPLPLPAESKLTALLRLLGRPIEVSLTETSWLKQQLPHEEADFLRRARIDLLVPIATGPERTEALLVLGAKRSEEPYSREDQDLLAAIAASLALLLEKPAPAAAPAPAGEAFEECPQCGACYDTGITRCAQEGATLTSIGLPRLLAERYRVERRLGRGGMGTVYEAGDTALERRVAVKLIRDDLVGSADAAERFRREARLAAGFAHPNVVTVYDFGVVAGTRAFLVMELLKGVTLREELSRQKRLPAPRTLEIMRGVCAAVEAAHQRQLIHRDLKPENLFLVSAETGEMPKVLDFGVAKFLPADPQATLDTRTGALVGTLRYMTPEQLRGQPADPAWDLWALAVVTYEMLTGAHPFAGATPAEWQRGVLAARFTPVAAHLPEAPARWQEFFERALALEPERRPPSARILFSQLEQALS